MSKTLLERLSDLEKKTDELECKISTTKKHSTEKPIDIKAEIEKYVNEKFVTNLYRNK